MSNTTDKFLDLLNTASAVTVDNGAMLTGISSTHKRGKWLLSTPSLKHAKFNQNAAISQHSIK